MGFLSSMSEMTYLCFHFTLLIVGAMCHLGVSDVILYDIIGSTQGYLSPIDLSTLQPKMSPSLPADYNTTSHSIPNTTKSFSQITLESGHS